MKTSYWFNQFLLVLFSISTITVIFKKVVNFVVLNAFKNLATFINYMQNKIFWYGFKRNLAELYFLLYYEKFISCDEDEFISHFTGKKFRVNENSRGKVIWNGEMYLLVLVLHHMVQKGFLQIKFDANVISLLKEHFEGISHNDFGKSEKLKNSARAKKLRSKLECLFPETSGLRCKQRLYYKARNKESLDKVLRECGIDVERL
jgi:hypothetical protein